MSAPALQPRYTAPLIQLVGFVRKELMDLIRQPRLLLVLVAGPFIILMLFAAGYDQDSVRLRTLFVGPEGSIYEDSVDSYGADVAEYVETLGFSSDIVAARAALEAGEIDLIVVFPPDPAETVLSGDQAVITVLHEKLDPLQQTAVNVSARVAIGELNAAVLEELVGQAQDTLVPMQQSLEDVSAAVDRLREAARAGDEAGVRLRAQDVRTSVDNVDRLTTLSSTVVAELRGDAADPAEQEQLARLQATLSEFDRALDQVDAARTTDDLVAAADAISGLEDRLGVDASTVVTIDPAVAVRPFVSDTENLLRDPPRMNEFFAPSAVSLLLQHLAVTFAALTLVRDESLGLFETFRVAPISARHVLAGKYLAFLTVGALTGAALIAGVVAGLGVPLRGATGWVALCVILLVAASIGLGMFLSAVARSDTQAVQYAMLVLLAGMFFGGFFLSLDAFRFPIRLLAWTLPVTYGIRWLQDVMLRGEAPSAQDLAGLLTLTAVYGGAAWAAFGRRLAVR